MNRSSRHYHLNTKQDQIPFENVNMWIYATAPPVPLGGKLFVALLVLTLVGVLLWRLRGGPFSGVSIAVAVVASAVAVFVLELTLSRYCGGGLHNRGVLAAIVGALCGVGFLRPVRKKLNAAQRPRTLRLCMMALVGGPLLGVILATLTILLSRVSPLDRGYTLGVFIKIGALAGLIGAGLIAVVHLCSKCDRYHD